MQTSDRLLKVIGSLLDVADEWSDELQEVWDSVNPNINLSLDDLAHELAKFQRALVQQNGD